MCKLHIIFFIRASFGARLALGYALIMFMMTKKQVVSVADGAREVLLLSDGTADGDAIPIRMKGIVFDIPEGASLAISGSMLLFEADKVRWCPLLRT